MLSRRRAQTGGFMYLERNIGQDIKIIKDWLSELAVKGYKGTISFYYSGYGDSGNDMDPQQFSEPVPDNVESALWNILPGGFENNEGGQGFIRLDPETKGITIEHEDNITDVEFTKYSY